MPIGTKRKAQLAALRKENKKRKQEKTTADAIAAAQAQELAVEVLTTFASLEEERVQAHAPERASTPVDFDISAMVAQYNLDQGLRSGPSQPYLHQGVAPEICTREKTTMQLMH